MPGPPAASASTPSSPGITVSVVVRATWARLFASHDLPLVEKYADTVVTISPGEDGR